MPEKQKELLIALAKEVKTCVVTSGEFVRNYRLSSPSSVQACPTWSARKGFYHAGTWRISGIRPFFSEPSLGTIFEILSMFGCILLVNLAIYDQ